MRELEQALATAQAEHMDYDFVQLQLQEFETTHAQHQKVLHIYEPLIKHPRTAGMNPLHSSLSRHAMLFHDLLI